MTIESYQESLQQIAAEFWNNSQWPLDPQNPDTKIIPVNGSRHSLLIKSSPKNPLHEQFKIIERCLLNSENPTDSWNAEISLAATNKPDFQTILAFVTNLYPNRPTYLQFDWPLESPA